MTEIIKIKKGVKEQLNIRECTRKIGTKIHGGAGRNKVLNQTEQPPWLVSNVFFVMKEKCTPGMTTRKYNTKKK